MWRFIFYTFPSISRLEKKLTEMEALGYRTDQVVLNYIFIFKKAPSKNVTYQLVYHLPKENPLLPLECDLKRKYNADPIKTRYSSTTLYRICVPMDRDDKAFFEESRRAYLLRVINRLLLLDCMFTILFSFMSFLLAKQGASHVEASFWNLGIMLSAVFLILRLIERYLMSKA